MHVHVYFRSAQNGNCKCCMISRLVQHPTKQWSKEPQQKNDYGFFFTMFSTSVPCCMPTTRTYGRRIAKTPRSLQCRSQYTAQQQGSIHPTMESTLPRVADSSPHPQIPCQCLILQVCFLMWSISRRQTHDVNTRNCHACAMYKLLCHVAITSQMQAPTFSAMWAHPAIISITYMSCRHCLEVIAKK